MHVPASPNSNRQGAYCPLQLHLREGDLSHAGDINKYGFASLTPNDA